MGILTKAPELIVIAKKLVDSVSSVRKNASVADRVSGLERNEEQQAKLIRDMARQLEDMTALMRVLSGRIAICLTCSIGALVLSLAALLRDYLQ
jgi:hypothetical protein